MTTSDELQDAQTPSVESLDTYLSAGRAWPFSESELTAGLRRFSGDPTLQIRRYYDREVTQRLPSVGKLRGIEVETSGADGERTYILVLKEPHGSTRTGAAGAGLREVSIYQTLCDHLPVKIPQLVAAHPRGEWLVLEHLPTGRRPDKWSAADYLLAAEQLALLHDRFWGLGADLEVYTWLEKPLHSDRDIYIQAARKSAQDLSLKPDSFIGSQTDVLEITDKIINHLDEIIAVLQDSPSGLLHGDYWPGNINIHQKDGLTVFDWEDAAIGPPVLDLLGFIQGSSWWFSPLPIPADEITHHYRQRLSQLGAHTYKEDEFSQLWDHAVMWTFINGWVSTLANTHDALLGMRLGALEEVLFAPLRAAVERRL
jgi:hypothetical protein